MREFTGTPRLTLLTLKRDRIQLPVWILVTAVVLAASLGIYQDIYPAEEDLRTATEFFAENPIARMFGLPSGVNLGAYTLVETYLFLAPIIALMSVLAVIRHTRQAEETRQAEMLASTAVGRYSILASALVVAALANVAMGLAIAGAFMAYGLETGGAVAAGVSLGSVGLSFAAIAAVTAQVSSSSRGASGLAAAAIGAGVLLTAFGGMLGEAQANQVVVDPAWPTWLSPVGWGQLIRPFGGNNWEFLLPTFVFIAVLCAAAFALTDRRDLGRGIFSEGRGPANASPGLLSPIGLAWRLQRGAFYGWAASTAVFGFLMGAILGDLEEALGGLDFSDLLLRIGGTDQLLAAYTVAVTSFYGSAISAYTVQVLLRMRIEESDGPLELLLGTRVSRSQWMLSYVVNALLGSLALLVLMGLSIGLGAGLTLGDLGEWLTDLLGAGLVQAPAVLLVGSLVVVAFAFLPRRATAISWAVFIFALLAGPMLGETMRLPDAVMDLSPFTHTPRLPVASFEAAPVAVMLAIAVLLTALGLGRFRRRDLAL